MVIILHRCRMGYSCWIYRQVEWNYYCARLGACNEQPPKNPQRHLILLQSESWTTMGCRFEPASHCYGAHKTSVVTIPAVSDLFLLLLFIFEIHKRKFVREVLCHAASYSCSLLGEKLEILILHSQGLAVAISSTLIYIVLGLAL